MLRSSSLMALPMNVAWVSGAVWSVKSSWIGSAHRQGCAGSMLESYKIPEGPAGLAIRKMSPPEIERLKVRLREHLPIAADGTIAYEAFANAVKGPAPD